jgi:tight adherence protein C
MEITPTVILIGSAVVGTVLLGSGLGMWFMEKRARMARVRAAVGRRDGRGAGGRARGGEKGALQKGAVDFMRKTTRGLSLVKDNKSHDVKMLLQGAGYRGRDAIVVFTFFKMVTPIVFVTGAALYVYGLDPIGRGPLVDLMVVIAAALLGGRLPDLVVGHMRKKRLEAIRKALPDALDMLVICTEAGLGADASLKRVVAETSRSASVLGEELNLTALELGFMPERRQALDHLAERVPLPSIAAFTNTLIQAEKFGTPLARAFKVLSQEQRNERMMRAEEKAGRLPATMTVPMMLFILPALFIVLIGPAALDILDNFIGME